MNGDASVDEEGLSQFRSSHQCTFYFLSLSRSFGSGVFIATIEIDEFTNVKMCHRSDSHSTQTNDREIYAESHAKKTWLLLVLHSIAPKPKAILINLIRVLMHLTGRTFSRRTNERQNCTLCEQGLFLFCLIFSTVEYCKRKIQTRVHASDVRQTLTHSQTTTTNDNIDNVDYDGDNDRQIFVTMRCKVHYFFLVRSDWKIFELQKVRFIPVACNCTPTDTYANIDEGWFWLSEQCVASKGLPIILFFTFCETKRET